MAMAVNIGRSPAQGLANGASPSPTPEEKEQLYDQLLQLRDVVLAGKHPQFKLPPSAVEQLKASLILPSEHAASSQGDAAINAHSLATNQQQHSQSSTPSSAPFMGGLPGLQNAAPLTSMNGIPLSTATSHAPVGGLDPIFLQKSEHLIKAETQLKRQRLERDLLLELEQQKKASRDKDHGIDAPSRINVDRIFLNALNHVSHVTGLKAAAAGSAASSSFDENDYYSSLVQSDWSSDDSSAKRSDRATGAFTGDFERLDGSASKRKRSAVPGSSMPNIPKTRQTTSMNESDNLYDMSDADDDDEYMPPDAAAFDSSRVHKPAVSMPQAMSEGDDSDYEPGEITVESIDPSPRYQPQQPMHPPPNVPVIRNHLTHIAAPQPNRVSPLTTNKDSNIELELVNGRPEIVHHKPTYHNHQVSRASSASPTAQSGPGPSKNKKKQKKRKRDNSPQGRTKRRHKQGQMNTPRSANQEPYIKDEPMSPPQSFADVPPAPQYEYSQYGAPPQVDLTGTRPIPQSQYAYDTQPRYLYPAPEPQQVVRVASPAHRPVQRDTQDLRRVASLHHARRPISPQRNNIYSPVAPYRAASMAYGDQRLRGPEQHAPQTYDNAYSSRGASPALMPPPPPPPPPAAPTHRIVQDQYGNRYYASEAAPSQTANIRASAVPESWERAPSRAAYAQPPPPTSGYYHSVDDRMPPPPAPEPSQQANGVGEPVEYTDADGYLVRGHRMRPAERQQQQQPRYSEVPTSPQYEDYRPYEQMAPPPALQPPRQQYESATSSYQSNPPRSYSVRPEQAAPAPPTYLRQASVAPIQYVEHRQGSVAPSQYAPQPASYSMAPPPQARATSVMPGYEYGGAPQHSQQQQAPPRFVDQYGNPVYPREVREVRQVEDYYRG